jgi:TatD DNase family protein
MLFDSHNHLQSGRFGKPVEELISEMKAAGISGCVVNATRESDWEAVRKIASEFPDFIRPAYGVHPWFSHTVKNGWQMRLREMLLLNPQSTIGEVGLDGWVDSPAMEVQRLVFLEQIALATGMNRIMTVHCLKAWTELFTLMDEAKSWPEKFLMHSFGGSIEVARNLLKRGAWFSFSGYFLQPRKRKVLEVFKSLPPERILLETDAPEMMPPQSCVNFPLGDEINHPANLNSIAEAFEKELGKGILQQIAENQRLFWI